ncbi:unnamed protein product [Microthlaspi erraticum]|nr:unnamed protein product [Microthlaspi erraticum]
MLLIVVWKRVRPVGITRPPLVMWSLRRGDSNSEILHGRGSRGVVRLFWCRKGTSRWIIVVLYDKLAEMEGTKQVWPTFAGMLMETSLAGGSSSREENANAEMGSGPDASKIKAALAPFFLTRFAELLSSGRMLSMR